MSIVDISEYAILRLKDQIAGNKAVLAAYRLGPLSERGLRVCRHVEMEQAQLEEELRLLELSRLDNKYDPNQPRVPAGNSDGGQWTDTGGSGAGIDPITTGATAATTGAHGTGVHKILERQINPAFNPQLVAELSLLKPMEETLNGLYSKNPRRGAEDTVRLDIYERVSDEGVCIYDIKAGKKGLAPGRMSELAESVARKYPEIKCFFVIQIRPSPGVIGRGQK